MLAGAMRYAKNLSHQWGFVRQLFNQPGPPQIKADADLPRQIKESLNAHAAGPNGAAQRASGHLFVIRHRQRRHFTGLDHDDMAAALAGYRPPVPFKRFHDFAAIQDR